MSATTKTQCTFYIMCPNCGEYIGNLFPLYKALEILKKKFDKSPRGLPIVTSVTTEETGPMHEILTHFELKICCRTHLFTTMVSEDYAQA